MKSTSRTYTCQRLPCLVGLAFAVVFMSGAGERTFITGASAPGHALLQLHTQRTSAALPSENGDADEESPDGGGMDAFDKDLAQDANNPLDADYVPGSETAHKSAQRNSRSRSSTGGPPPGHGDIDDVALTSTSEVATSHPSTTSTTSMVPLVNRSTCATREDPRAYAWTYTTAAAGTPCIFGVDARDEGSHCIYGDGKYGSFGWCFTSNDSRSWGSCNEHCPLFGSNAVLSRKLEKVSDELHRLTARVDRLSGATGQEDEKQDHDSMDTANKSAATLGAKPVNDKKLTSSPKHSDAGKREANKKANQEATDTDQAETEGAHDDSSHATDKDGDSGRKPSNNTTHTAARKNETTKKVTKEATDTDQAESEGDHDDSSDATDKDAESGRSLSNNTKHSAPGKNGTTKNVSKEATDTDQAETEGDHDDSSDAAGKDGDSVRKPSNNTKHSAPGKNGTTKNVSKEATDTYHAATEAHHVESSDAADKDDDSGTKLSNSTKHTAPGKNGTSKNVSKEAKDTDQAETEGDHDASGTKPSNNTKNTAAGKNGTSKNVSKENKNSTNTSYIAFKAAPEKRKRRSKEKRFAEDGELHTRMEFIDFYGKRRGLTEWARALTFKQEPRKTSVSKE